MDFLTKAYPTMSLLSESMLVRRHLLANKMFTTIVLRKKKSERASRASWNKIFRGKLVAEMPLGEVTLIGFGIF